MISVGSVQCDDIRLGPDKLDFVYAGSQLIWPEEVVTPSLDTPVVFSAQRQSSGYLVAAWSAFSVSNGSDTCVYTEIQVGSTSKVFSGQRTSLSASDLVAATAGQSFRVRYQGSVLGWSEWSSAYPVTAAPSLNTPVVFSAQRQSSGYLVASWSAFGVSNGSDSCVSTEIQVGSTSKVFSGQRTSLSASDLVAATAGQSFRVRYQGSALGWSSWSNYYVVTAAPSLNTPVVFSAQRQSSGYLVASWSAFGVSNGSDSCVSTEIQVGSTSKVFSGQRTSLAVSDLVTGNVGQSFRVRYQGSSLGWSQWSGSYSITSSQPASVATPQIQGAEAVFVSDDMDAGYYLSMASSTFSVINGSDSCVETQVQIADSNGSELDLISVPYEVAWWDPFNYDNRVSLASGGDKVRTRYRGSSLGWSQWSDYHDISW